MKMTRKKLLLCLMYYTFGFNPFECGCYKHMLIWCISTSFVKYYYISDK